MTKIKALLDNFLGKFISRKLLVFLIVTWALFVDKVDAVNWVNVAMIYIGGQTVIDSIAKLRGK